MRFLALDPSPRCTGYAIGDPAMKVPSFGNIRLSAWGDDEGRRVLTFGRQLTDICRKYRVTHIFREQLPHNLTPNSNVYQYQVAIIFEIARVAAKLSLPLEQVTIADWRYRFIGTSKALPGLKGDKGREWLKQRAVAKCLLRGWMVEDPDAAEACGILDYALAAKDAHYCGRTDSIFRRTEMDFDQVKRTG